MTVPKPTKERGRLQDHEQPFLPIQEQSFCFLAKDAGPDGELIRLCAEYCDGLAAHVALVHRNALRGEDSPPWTCPSTDHLVVQILAIPANSLAGVRAKAATLQAYQQAFVSSCDMFVDRQIAASIVADVLRR